VLSKILSSVAISAGTLVCVVESTQVIIYSNTTTTIHSFMTIKVWRNCIDWRFPNIIGVIRNLRTESEPTALLAALVRNDILLNTYKNINNSRSRDPRQNDDQKDL
jgi:hypothetical protein